MIHIKRTYLLCVAAVLATFQSCKQQPDYKALRQQVVAIHDTIMSEDGRLMGDQSALKTMLTPASLIALKKADAGLDTAAKKATAITLIRRLDSVSNAMGDWMNEFNPDVQGKTVQQATEYFGIERVKVGELDSSYKALLKTSAEFLKKAHLKPADSKMKMKM